MWVFLHADPPLQVVFSSLKSPQSLSPSQAQWSGIQRPLVHWNWVLEHDWMHPTSSLPSPQSLSTHMRKLSWKARPHKHTIVKSTDKFLYGQTLISMVSIFIRFLSSPESQCHFTLMHRPLEQLNWVRGSQVGKAEKGCIQEHIKYNPCLNLHISKPSENSFFFLLAQVHILQPTLCPCELLFNIMWVSLILWRKVYLHIIQLLSVGLYV